jgi:cytochrome c oxidase subunit II
MATEPAGNITRVNRTEKRVLLGATLFVGASLALIAYATWGLGISVPSCVPASKGFDQASIIKHEGKNYEIHCIARMWAFEPTVVRVPTGSTLDVYVVSEDVTHGMQIVGTNANMMVVPGAVANTEVHFRKPGIYTIVCHEYCGTGHQNMSARIEVSDQVTDISAEGIPTPGAGGKKILEEKGCLACHSVDGSPLVGPTFKGAWGQTVELTDGTRHVLNDDFFRELMEDPSKYTVKDFPPVMPKLPLKDEEIKQIEEYLKGLK